MSRSGLLTLLFLLLLPAVRPVPASALSCQWWDTTCQQLQQAQQHQQDLQDQLRQIQQGISDTLQQVQATLRLIDQINGQIDLERKAIARTQAQLEETQRRIRFTEADIARRQAQLTVRQQLLDQRIRALDKQGSLNYFELIVTSESFSQLIDRILVMQDVIRGDQRLVDQLKLERDQVAQLQKQLQQQRDQEAALLHQQEEQKAQLERSLADQQAALAYLEQLLARYRQQQQQMQADLQQTQSRIVQLQQQYQAELAGLGGGSGRFAWPLQGVITQGYGCSTIPFEWYDPACPPPHTFHYGLDIANDYGSVIRTADSGVVGFVGWDTCFGNHIIVVHGNGYSTLYAHLSGFLVSQGQVVRRGQPIGLEGSTGCSTGPHLHFGVSYNGSWVNPLNYLS